MSNNNDLVGVNGAKLKVEQKKPEEIHFEPHPNKIMALPVKKDQTRGGVYLPENVNGKDDTPLVKIAKIGRNVKEQYGDWLKAGDFVYVEIRFVEPVTVDDTAAILMMADAIHGKLTQRETDE